MPIPKSEQNRRLTRKQLNPQFQLIKGGWNYRNREDQTLLPPNTLVLGSQNVVTNTSGRLQLVPGFTLDGPSSVIAAPIQSSYDFLMSVSGNTRHLRAYLDPTSGKGILQYRNKDSSNVITYPTLS